MEIAGTGFVLLRGPDPVPLLRARFPEFVASADVEFDDDEPYFAYGMFADFLSRQRADQDLWARAISFLNDLVSNTPSLHDLVSVAVLEPLADDIDLIRVLKAELSPAARAIVEDIERTRLAYHKGPNVPD